MVTMAHFTIPMSLALGFRRMMLSMGWSPATLSVKYPRKRTGSDAVMTVVICSFTVSCSISSWVVCLLRFRRQSCRQKKWHCDFSNSFIHVCYYFRSSFPYFPLSFRSCPRTQSDPCPCPGHFFACLSPPSWVDFPFPVKPVSCLVENQKGNPCLHQGNYAY